MNRAATGAWLTIIAASVSAPWTTLAANGSLNVEVYDRASRFLPENRDRLVLNADVTPHWRPGSRERFTYRKQLPGNRAAFMTVDATTGIQKLSFDQSIIAVGLSLATGRRVDAEALPFSDYDEVAPDSIRFAVDSKTWVCSTRVPSCISSIQSPTDPATAPSPDGRWLAYLENHNLWVRSADGRERFALTNDGETDYGYGAYPAWTTAETLASGEKIPPAVVWSPDSRRLYTLRVDERHVGTVTLVQSTPPDGGKRAKDITFRYPYSNDAAVPMADQWIFDVISRRGVRVDIAPEYTSANLLFEKLITWSGDSRIAYTIVRSRYAKDMTLYAVDAERGTAHAVVTDSGRTFVEPIGFLFRPMVRSIGAGEVVWYSERDGYGHLYLYDVATGALRRRLTAGNWSVDNVVRCDEADHLLYFSAGEREPGADPLYLRMYSVNLQNGDIRLLTPEDAAHQVAFGDGSSAFSPSGRYFVDTYSRPDMPPRTVLRRSDGRLIAQVQTADISGLARDGFVAPERFSALAADGKTRLYGTLLRPSDFDPRRSYPVIDYIYGAPQSVHADPGFLDNVFSNGFSQTISELGFIVVLVDGRGTPGRSKAFHDDQYGHMGTPNYLDDHVAIVRELGRRYSYLDLKRVGIYGSSSGGYATITALLAHPDFYRVGIADAGGGNGLSTSMDAWGEIFNGREVGSNYLDTDNTRRADRLKAKLFIIHGEMDTISPPTGTFRFVDSLIKANKDFDLLIVPNAGHTTLTASNATPEVYHYALRRSWDFLVRNLLDEDPPPGYDLNAVANTASGSK